MFLCFLLHFHANKLNFRKISRNFRHTNDFRKRIFFPKYKRNNIHNCKVPFSENKEIFWYGCVQYHFENLHVYIRIKIY